MSLEPASGEEGCKIKAAAYLNRPPSRCLLTGRFAQCVRVVWTLACVCWLENNKNKKTRSHLSLSPIYPNQSHRPPNKNIWHWDSIEQIIFTFTRRHVRDCSISISSIVALLSNCLLLLCLRVARHNATNASIRLGGKRERQFRKWARLNSGKIN